MEITEKKSQLESISLKKRFRLSEYIIEKIIFLSSFLAILGVILIFVFVFREALPVLTNPEVKKEASLKLFFSTTIWQPVSDLPRYGFIPIIVGTLKVVLVALFISIPVSVGAAIYTSEFAPLRIKEYIKPVHKF